MTVISDLLDIIHQVIIKHYGENEIILEELKSIDTKINEGKLENLSIDKDPFFKVIVYKTYQELEKQ